MNLPDLIPDADVVVALEADELGLDSVVVIIGSPRLQPERVAQPMPGIGVAGTARVCRTSATK
jgi:hypothetical protein